MPNAEDFSLPKNMKDEPFCSLLKKFCAEAKQQKLPPASACNNFCSRLDKKSQKIWKKHIKRVGNDFLLTAIAYARKTGEDTKKAHTIVDDYYANVAEVVTEKPSIFSCFPKKTKVVNVTDDFVEPKTKKDAIDENNMSADEDSNDKTAKKAKKPKAHKSSSSKGKEKSSSEKSKGNDGEAGCQSSTHDPASASSSTNSEKSEKGSNTMFHVNAQNVIINHYS